MYIYANERNVGQKGVFEREDEGPIYALAFFNHANECWQNSLCCTQTIPINPSLAKKEEKSLESLRKKFAFIKRKTHNKKVFIAQAWKKLWTKFYTLIENET